MVTLRALVYSSCNSLLTVALVGGFQESQGLYPAHPRRMRLCVRPEILLDFSAALTLSLVDEKVTQLLFSSVSFAFGGVQNMQIAVVTRSIQQAFSSLGYLIS